MEAITIEMMVSCYHRISANWLSKAKALRKACIMVIFTDFSNEFCLSISVHDVTQMQQLWLVTMNVREENYNVYFTEERAQDESEDHEP